MIRKGELAMKRIFLEDDLSDNVTITGNDANHLAHALRAKKGDQIVAVDRRGNKATLELIDFGRDSIQAKRVSEITKVENIFVKHLTLAECLPKQNKFDYIVEKVTELDIDKIVPLISDRTIARPENLRAKAKLDRWQRIAKEAAEQSARDTLPDFEKITELEDWLKKIAPTLGRYVQKDGVKKFNCKGALLLFCNEVEHEQKIQDILRDYKSCDCDKDIIILIGPEGGFSEREAKEIKFIGGVSVTLGERILKTDTAAISTLANIQYELN